MFQKQNSITYMNLNKMFPSDTIPRLHYAICMFGKYCDLGQNLNLLQISHYNEIYTKLKPC